MSSSDENNKLNKMKSGPTSSTNLEYHTISGVQNIASTTKATRKIGNIMTP